MVRNTLVILNPERVVSLNRNQVVSLSGISRREQELLLSRAAWAINAEGTDFVRHLNPLNFRLEGPPGVGKNEIVYEIVRKLTENNDVPFYSIQGHEEMTPEDLSILLTPDNTGENNTNLILRASPLATAIFEGGIFFFDEINRVPERALSPLASVLDSRKYIYSAMTGIKIAPKNEEARSRFRFCCALNPNIGDGVGNSLPEYIDQRTLPIIKVDYHQSKSLIKIVSNITEKEEYVSGFEKWHDEEIKTNITTRQAIAIIHYALNLRFDQPSAYDSIKKAALYILGNSTEI